MNYNDVKDWLSRKIEKLQGYLMPLSNEMLVILAKGYIQHNFGDGLKECANNLKVSSAHLSRTFHKITKMTFAENLNMTRIEKSKRLLSTDDKLPYISAKSGSKNTEYFSRLFKKIVGITPAKYREIEQTSRK